MGTNEQDDQQADGGIPVGLAIKAWAQIESLARSGIIGVGEARDNLSQFGLWVEPPEPRPVDIPPVPVFAVDGDDEQGVDDDQEDED